MRLFLNSESEVAGITEAGHDIAVSVYFRIYSTEPNGGFVFRECFFDVFHGLFRCNDGANMDMSGIAFSDKCPVAQFHRCTCGEHRVCNHERFAVQARSGEVLYADVKVFFFLVFAVGGHKGVFRMVEVV